MIWSAARTEPKFKSVARPDPAGGISESTADGSNACEAHYNAWRQSFSDPIFQGLAISLLAGEVAATLFSRMVVPVMYYLDQRMTNHDTPSA